MNQAVSLAWGWLTALAIAVPFVALFWWARRHEPVSGDEVDYSVGVRAQTPTAPPAAVTGAAATAVVDAPVPANPAALAHPTDTVTPPASIVALPEHGPLPPEPPGFVAPTATTQPAAAPTPVAVPEAAVAIVPPATVPIEPPQGEPVVQAAPPAGSTPAATPKPQPAVAAAPTPPAAVKEPEKAAEPAAPKAAGAAQAATPASARPVPTASVTPAPRPEPQPVTAAPVSAAPTAAASATPEPVAPAPAPAAPSGEGDDFSRLYGPDAAAIDALHAAGLNTYRDLAGASIDHLRQIMADAGLSSMDPGTWPQQARFAAGGKWKQLDSRFQPKT